MDPHTSTWFDSHTSHAQDWAMQALLKSKGRHTISVVIPALNEAETIGAIVTTVREELMVEHPLIDEVVVIDGASSDDTASLAAQAGAKVFAHDLISTGFDVLPGKGEAMWRSLFVTKGDIIVFLDGDLRNFSATYVTGLLGPLLTDPAVDLVKAFYDRPAPHRHDAIDLGARSSNDEPLIRSGGGRVTELVARPLLNLHWPELSGIIQPLSGEYAARRSLLEQLPFPTGYGIELGMLIDTLQLRGLNAIAQVDVGERQHRHQDLQALGRMATEIWQIGMDRLDRDGHIVTVREPHTSLTQFESTIDGHSAFTSDITVAQRPPAVAISQYTDRVLLD